MTQNQPETILLLWNPKEWAWPKLNRDVEKVKLGEIVEDRWNCGVTKKVRAGSRFYLLRTANEGGGIVAAGTIVSDVFRDKHWQEEKAQAGLMANFVRIRFSALSRTPFITRDELRKPPINWNYKPQQSGTALPVDLAIRLDHTWSQRVAGKGEDFVGKAFRLTEGMSAWAFAPYDNLGPGKKPVPMSVWKKVWAVCRKYGYLSHGYVQDYEDLLSSDVALTGKELQLARSQIQIKPGDYVIARKGQGVVLGVGVALEGDRADTSYVAAPPELQRIRDREDSPPHWAWWRHCTRVKWLEGTAGLLPAYQQGWLVTLVKVTADQLAQIRPYLNTSLDAILDLADGYKPGKVALQPEVPVRDRVLEVTANIELRLGHSTTHAVLLFGPAGTGKTYTTERVADLYGGLGTKRVELVQFHPAYAYEDFMEGLRPKSSGGQVEYPIEDGVFKKFCNKSRQSSEPHLFIIDEINRGNIAKVMGELMYCLEYRGEQHSITLPYSGEKFFIPENVHILGTMNSSDRSIATLDVALRRRFQFVELAPDSSLLENVALPELGGDGDVGDLMDRLNDRILDALGRHKLLGHSYFMPPDYDAQTKSGSWDADSFKARWFHQILPLLEEYFVDDLAALRKVIGTSWESDKAAKDSPHFVPVSVAQMDNKRFLECLRAMMSQIRTQDAQGPIEEE